MPQFITAPRGLIHIAILAISITSADSAMGQSDQAPADLGERVRQLVDQLDDRQLEKREAAEKGLLELGAGALRYFPEITDRTAAEVKQRLSRVRTELEKATAALNTEGARITLAGKMSVDEVFAALEEQSGNKVSGYDRQSGEIEVDFADVPYWEALDQILDQLDLDIDAFGGEAQTLVLTSRADGEQARAGSAAYQGAFRFEAQRVETRRDLRNPSVNTLRLTMNIGWEPRLRPVSMQQPIAQLSAVDDRGEPIGIDPSRTTPLSARTDMGISTVEMVVPLVLPPREALSIASLKGQITVMVPGGEEEFQFEDLARARDAESTKAGVTVIFERSRRNQALYEVRMRVRFDEVGDALQSNRAWIYENEAFILTADGERVENAGLLDTDRRGNEVGVAYLFAVDGLDGCKFVYRTPASMLRFSVDYELEDIQLP